LDSDKVLLVCDRGALDNKAYMAEDEFKSVLMALKANEIEFWEITPDKMLEVITAPYFTDFEEKRDSLISQNGYLLSKPDSTVFLFSFDANPSLYPFLGNGAYEQPKKEEKSLFAEIESGKLDENREYEISFWNYVGGENYGQDKQSWRIFISQREEASEQDIPLLEAISRTTPIILGDWALATYRFMIQDRNLPTRFSISRTRCKGYQTTIDEVLIRPLDVNVWRVLEEDESGVRKLYKNGQIIESYNFENK
jgi:hypothetical protein